MSKWDIDREELVKAFRERGSLDEVLKEFDLTFKEAFEILELESRYDTVRSDKKLNR